MKAQSGSAPFKKPSMAVSQALLACSLLAAATRLVSAGVAGFLLAGCLADEGGSTDTGVDPFPKPLGPKIVPLERELRSDFRYVEFDTSGNEVLRLQALTLYIQPRGSGVYSYSFEDSTRGYLVRFIEPLRQGVALRESTGVYIVGRYAQGASHYDSVPTFWLPQFPPSGTTWPLGPGRTMELVDGEAAYLTEPIFPSSAEYPVEDGFQRHATLLFRETAGDTLTYYHFAKGVGCVGFERSAGGRLLASGTLAAFYRPYW
jgi:hypothetical protein